MIWIVLGCAAKNEPTVDVSPPPIEVIISENEWAEDGLQVSIGIRATHGVPMLDRVLLQTTEAEYPMTYGAKPLSSEWFDVAFIVPLERVAGQYIQGEVWLAAVEQSHSFALVSPFFGCENHDGHDEH